MLRYNNEYSHVYLL